MLKIIEKALFIFLRYLTRSQILNMEEKIALWLAHNLANYEKKNSKLHKIDVQIIVEWLNSHQAPQSITRLSVPQAIEKSRRWKKIDAENKFLEEDWASLEKICSWTQNELTITWVKLVSEQNYKREASLMNHCVSEYFKGKKSTIYSLRDEKNNPHATIEVSQNSHQIFQIKGPANGVVPSKYQWAVVKFLDFLYDTQLITISAHIKMLEDLGNFFHLAYQNQIMSGDTFMNLEVAEDFQIIAHNLSLEKVPPQISSDLCVIKNARNLKQFKSSFKGKTLVIANCKELEQIELSSYPEVLIIDNCPRLQGIKGSITVKKIIINKCPKIKKIAEELIAEEVLLMRCFIDKLSDHSKINKLKIFKSRVGSFGRFQVDKFLFSNFQFLTPSIQKNRGKFSQINILKYQDLLDFYIYYFNFIFTEQCENLAKTEISKIIDEAKADNLLKIQQLAPFSLSKNWWKKYLNLL